MIITIMLIVRFIWKWVKRIIFFGIIASVLSVLLFKYVMIPFTPLMISRSVEHMVDGKLPKLKKTWVALDDMSPAMPLAAICAEDGKFMTHNGFDFEAMKKAWKNNDKKGKTMKGGSTISQQVAKNVFLWQGRNFVRKGLEAYFTVLIELLWSKHRIMEVYLNVIEMGDGIYGAEAASQAYYKKSCKNLSKGEAALIVACFPNPRVLSPLSPNKQLYFKQQRIVRFMNYTGKIDWGK